MHETVAVPEPVTLAGEIAPHVRLAGTESVRLTTPAKPFTAVIVMVDVAVVLGGNAAGLLAAIVKSTTVNVTVAVCVIVPLVPVIVTL